MSAVPSKAQALDVQTGVRRIFFKEELYKDFNHGTVVIPFVPFDVRGAVPTPVEFESGVPILDDVALFVLRLGSYPSSYPRPPPSLVTPMSISKWARLFIPIVREYWGNLFSSGIGCASTNLPPSPKASDEKNAGYAKIS